MAEETLVIESLTAEMIQRGQQLLNAADSRMTVDAAFWLLRPETTTWRFVLASPAVKLEGPKAVYRKLQALLKRTNVEPYVSMNNLSVIDRSDPLVSLLRSAIRTQHNAVGAIRFTGNTINGVFVPDAYIYRLA